MLIPGLPPYDAVLKLADGARNTVTGAVGEAVSPSSVTEMSSSRSPARTFGPIVMEKSMVQVPEPPLETVPVLPSMSAIPPDTD